MSIRTILERVRTRVANGDWRNHLVGKGMGDWKFGPGCLIQLLAQEGDGDYLALDAISKATYNHYGIGVARFNDSRADEKMVLEILDEIILNGPDQ